VTKVFPGTAGGVGGVAGPFDQEVTDGAPAQAPSMRVIRGIDSIFIMLDLLIVLFLFYSANTLET
jgi:hypothetical protein